MWSSKKKYNLWGATAAGIAVPVKKLVVLQIRSGTIILTLFFVLFYKCNVPKWSTTADILPSFSSGRWGNSLPISEQYQNSFTTKSGKNKSNGLLKWIVAMNCEKFCHYGAIHWSCCIVKPPTSEHHCYHPFCPL